MRPYQSRKASLAEAVADISTGFIASWLVWLFLVPVIWPNHQTTVQESFDIVLLFTVVSLTRRYVWRRVFERIL